MLSGSCLHSLVETRPSLLHKPAKSTKRPTASKAEFTMHDDKRDFRVLRRALLLFASDIE